MAKRFTDTEKFKDPWYRRLPTKYKLLWDYLLCSCNHAGIISIDLEFIEMVLNEKLEDDCLELHFGERLQKLPKPFEYFIPKFIKFQYGELSPKSPMGAKVIKSLAAHGIDYRKLESDTHPIGYLEVSDTLEEEEEEEREEEYKEEEEREEVKKGKKTRSKKTTKLSDISPLEVIIPDERGELIDWLRTGTPKLQQKILETYDSGYLAGVIEKAYYWQLENKKRGAGSFLSTWIERDDNKKFRNNLSPALSDYEKELLENEKNCPLPSWALPAEEN